MTAPQNFRSYELSVQFYKACRPLKLPAYAKDQLIRAAMSVSLNLAEGSAKTTVKERQRFYSIAFASLRECQAVIRLEDLYELHPLADHLGTCLYKLTRSS